MRLNISAGGQTRIMGGAVGLLECQFGLEIWLDDPSSESSEPAKPLAASS